MAAYSGWTWEDEDLFETALQKALGDGHGTYSPTCWEQIASEFDGRKTVDEVRSLYAEKMARLRDFFKMMIMVEPMADLLPSYEGWTLEQDTCFATAMDNALENPFDIDRGLWEYVASQIGDGKTAADVEGHYAVVARFFTEREREWAAARDPPGV